MLRVATLLVTAIACTLFFVGSASQASAESRACKRLDRQLASLSGGGGKSSTFRKYDRAVRKQRGQLSGAQRRLNKYRCNSGFLIFGRNNSNRCVALRRNISKMRSNLARLEGKRARYSGKSGNTKARRASIRRAMRNNGCGQQRVAKRREEIKKRKKKKDKGYKIITREERASSTPQSRQIVTRRYTGQTYRTLCVRTCDGYYFPISFSTTRDRFSKDLSSCERMCPGTETALFYHKVPEQESEAMISYRTGKPYRKLENAYNYRKAVDSNCSCKFNKRGGFTTIAGAISASQVEEVKIVKKKKVALVTTPTSRVDRGEDPETLANRRGNLLPNELDSVAAEKQVSSIGGKKIRVVGAAFFPVQ